MSLTIEIIDQLIDAMPAGENTSPTIAWTVLRSPLTQRLHERRRMTKEAQELAASEADKPQLIPLEAFTRGRQI